MRHNTASDEETFRTLADVARDKADQQTNIETLKAQIEQTRQELQEQMAQQEIDRQARAAARQNGGR